MGRVRRGEIWTVAGGVYSSKPRPALIVQDDRFDATYSDTVLPLATTTLDAPLLRAPLPPTTTTGLRQVSFVMIDKLTTVRRTNLTDKVGRASTPQLIDVERALLVLLGLAD